MSGLLQYVPIVSKLVGSSSTSRSIDLPSVEIHNVSGNPDKRAECLEYLLKANHVTYSIVYHNLQYDNHTPHILCSAYLLGAEKKQLQTIYDAEVQALDRWKPSPAEIIDEDWRDFLGDKRYQKAYVDYFEDKVVMEHDYEWKGVANRFLFSDEGPLFHGLIGGLGHPLIHLGYAYEMDNRGIAVEALGLACVQYNFFHKYLDDRAYSSVRSPLAGQSPLQLLETMSKDKRFPEAPDLEDLESFFHQHESLIMEYWNGWQLNDPLKQFELSQEAAVALLVATVRPGTHAFNFFIVHLLTTSHTVRILLPFFPKKHHITLVREWWLLVIAIFIVKDRPMPDWDNVDKDLKQKTWRYVEDKSLNSQWATDAHYVKAIRAMREAARTWGDIHERYLSAAVTFVDNFRGWTF